MVSHIPTVPPEAWHSGLMDRLSAARRKTEPTVFLAGSYVLAFFVICAIVAVPGLPVWADLALSLLAAVLIVPGLLPERQLQPVRVEDGQQR